MRFRLRSGQDGGPADKSLIVRVDLLHPTTGEPTQRVFCQQLEPGTTAKTEPVDIASTNSRVLRFEVFGIPQSSFERGRVQGVLSDRISRIQDSDQPSAYGRQVARKVVVQTGVLDALESYENARLEANTGGVGRRSSENSEDDAESDTESDKERSNDGASGENDEVECELQKRFKELREKVRRLGKHVRREQTKENYNCEEHGAYKCGKGSADKCDPVDRRNPFEQHACIKLRRLAKVRAQLSGALNEKDTSGCDPRKYPELDKIEEKLAKWEERPERWQAVEQNRNQYKELREAKTEVKKAADDKNKYVFVPIAVTLVPVADRVVDIEFGAGDIRVEGVRRNQSLGLMVDGAPWSTEVAFAMEHGERIKSSLPNVVSTLLNVVAPGVGAAADKDRKKPEVAVEGISPVHPTGTRAYVLEGVPPNREMNVRVCEASCSDESSKMNRVNVKPKQGWRAAGVFDVGFNTFAHRLGGDCCAYNRVEGYEPVGGTQGSEQTFALQSGYDPAEHIMFSVLVGARNDEWFIGFGPTVVNGRGERAFRQWNIRVGYFVASHFLLNWGMSIGSFKVADPDAAEERSVARDKAGMVPPAPHVPRSRQPVFAVNVGVGIDLSLLGDGASEVVKAFGSE